MKTHDIIETKEVKGETLHWVRVTTNGSFKDHIFNDEQLTQIEDSIKVENTLENSFLKHNVNYTKETPYYEQYLGHNSTYSRSESMYKAVAQDFNRIGLTLVNPTIEFDYFKADVILLK